MRICLRTRNVIESEQGCLLATPDCGNRKLKNYKGFAATGRAEHKSTCPAVNSTTKKCI
jgi:hypothetical protein